MNDQEMPNTRLLRTVRNLLIVGLAIALVSLLKTLSSLLLPLVLALLVTMLTLPLVFWLKRLGLPKIIIIPLVALLTIFVVVVVINILANTLTDLISQQTELTQQFSDKVQEVYQLLGHRFHLDLDYDISPLVYLWDQIDISQLVRNFAGLLGSFGSSFFLFILYYVFLLIGVSDYKQYLHYVAADNQQMLKSFETLQQSISTYISVKSVISFATAVIVFIVCKAFGMSFALFWAFLTFVLNFIPTIGSIISTLSVIFFAFIQFDSYSRVIFISVLLTSNQMIIGNFLDPLIMGNRLRLNTVTVIFGLVFWGFIWDIPGMLLSVPLMVMIKLTLAQSESLGILARIMGNPATEERRKIPWFKRKKEKKDDSQ